MTRAESRPEVRRDPAAVSSDGAPSPQTGDEAPPRADSTALPGTAAAAEEPEGTLPQLLKIAGAVLGSTTVLTGLLFYFGRLHITGFFRYFRVNFTVLDLTPNDYLVRSADGLFVPMTTAAIVGLLALWLNRLVLDRLRPDRRRQVLRVAVPTAAGLGALLVIVAFVELFAGHRLFASRSWVGGLALAGGVLLLACAAHLARPGRSTEDGRRRRTTDVSALAEGGFAFVLVTIGLFWAVGSYAIDVGTSRAQETVAGLADAPDAVLYSEKSLRLAVAGVTEFRCQDPEAAYRFRYDGLKLVLASGGQYLFVSGDWSLENGTAVLIPRTDAVRLEFAPPGQQRSPVC